MTISHFDGLAKSSGIYLIWNSHTWRTYIGSCKQFHQRWIYGHLRSLLANKHQNKFLQADFNKCKEELGHDDFLEFHIIEDMPGSSREARLAVEDVWIKLLFDNGRKCYNLRDSATSREGCRSRNPKETNRKIAQAMKGRKLSEDAKRRIGEASRQRKISNETREKMSRAHQGKHLPEEVKNKIGRSGTLNHRFGKCLSKEERQKLSDAHKGNRHTEETKIKMALARKLYWEKRRSEQTQGVID